MSTVMKESHSGGLLTSFRLKYFRFLDSNKDFLLFIIFIVSGILQLFQGKTILLKLYTITVSVYPWLIYANVKNHKLIIGFLFPIWGAIFLYQIFLRLSLGMVSGDFIFKNLLLAGIPYAASWVMNYKYPDLAFRFKVVVFILFCIIALLIKQLLP